MNACRMGIGWLTVLLVLVPAAAGAAAVPGPRDTAMVLVPAGEFVMGTEGTGDDNPPHPVRLDAF